MLQPTDLRGQGCCRDEGGSEGQKDRQGYSVKPSPTTFAKHTHSLCMHTQPLHFRNQLCAQRGWHKVPSKPIQPSNWDETATVSSSVAEHGESLSIQRTPFHRNSCSQQTGCSLSACRRDLHSSLLGGMYLLEEQYQLCWSWTYVLEGDVPLPLCLQKVMCPSHHACRR